VTTGAQLAPEEEELLEQLSGLTDPQQCEEILERHPALISTRLINFLTEDVRQKVRSDTQRAIRIAEIAISIARRLDDPDAAARAFRARGNAAYACGDHKAAVSFYDQALELFESRQNMEEVGKTLSTSLLPLGLLGEYDRAFQIADRARQIFSAQENTWRLARLDINVGNIFYRQDRFTEALEHYERAYRQLQTCKDAEGLGVVLSNLAVCYISLNKFSQALSTYQDARSFCSAHNMPLLVTQADYNIAYLYYLRGEYSQAIRMLRAASVRSKELNDNYHRALCSVDLSELYLELNLHAEAARLAREAGSAFERLSLPYERAKALAFEAIAYSQQNHIFGAIALFERSKKIFLSEKNYVWPSLIDVYQALLMLNDGRLYEARRLARGALDFFTSIRMFSKSVLCRLLLVRIALRAHDLASARAECSQAIEELAGLELPVLSYQAFFLLGQVEAAEGRNQEAYSAFQQSRRALESMRSSLRGEELKIAFLKNRGAVYEYLVELCLMPEQQWGGKEEAFGYIEQSKSRSLLELISRPVPMLTDDDVAGSELVRSIRNVREELNWYYHLIEREQLQPQQRFPERIARLQNEVRERESDLIRALQEASVAEADQAGVHSPTHLALETIRSALQPEELVLEYFQAQDRIFACVLSHRDLEIIPITIESRVASQVRLLQFQLSKFRMGAAHVHGVQTPLLRSTLAHLQQLHQELIAPIAGLLQGKHLIIVPHGVLHYVPFQALYDGQRHLIDFTSVSYAPSASVYALCRSKDVNTSGPVLLLAVPDEQAPSIMDEVQVLGNVLDDSEVYVGPAANHHVLRSRGRGARIVHIASHGYFRQDNPMFSSIRLGDAHLNLYDLYQLRIPADLVTLSGCSTGLNSLAAGDELMGLARGVLNAGARSLIVSSWDVHDSSTAAFMKAFYGRLKQGIGKAAALRETMLDIRKQWPHPYHWAAFALIGGA
jgi:CHAT domain-containing protein